MDSIGAAILLSPVEITSMLLMRITELIPKPYALPLLRIILRATTTFVPPSLRVFFLHLC